MFAQASKPPRIGLRTHRASARPRCGGSAARPSQSYVEGRTIDIEYRWADGRPDRRAAARSGSVRARVAVIVTGGEQAILAARQATSTIPIYGSGDDAADGIGGELAPAGGNITGMTILSPDLSRKRLQLLKEVLPRMRASRFCLIPNIRERRQNCRGHACRRPGARLAARGCRSWQRGGITAQFSAHASRLTRCSRLAIRSLRHTAG